MTVSVAYGRERVVVEPGRARDVAELARRALGLVGLEGSYRLEVAGVPVDDDATVGNSVEYELVRR